MKMTTFQILLIIAAVVFLPVSFGWVFIQFVLPILFFIFIAAFIYIMMFRKKNVS